LVGLAHEIQKVPHINAESWDVPLAMVVTDRNVYQMGSGQTDSGQS
jgi:5-formyltetrahydrofolate cyclo-ligase